MNLEQLVQTAEREFAQVTTLPDLEQLKAKYFGKSGLVTQLMTSLGKCEPAERKVLGQQYNLAKQAIEAAVALRKAALEDAILQQRLAAEAIDVTLAGRGQHLGGAHPITRSWDRLVSIFTSMGFAVAEGPEIETDWFNFTALNSPENHPARSMQDTFYLDALDEEGRPLLLRTHTSPMQIRFARNNPPPIRVIAPGRTYRVDSDATHSPMFHQIEGLWIDKHISFADLKGVYLHFVRAFFAPQAVQVRYRPSYFPFTEPSAEIDILFEEGNLKGRWLEISGAGQVHPSVIKNMGLDPDVYIGFAFGTGIERLTMLRYGVDDLRLFYENDLRFLAQFSV